MISKVESPVVTTDAGRVQAPDLSGVYGVSRPVKVIITGAGIGGISTACILSKKIKNLSYTIYDKNDRVGGTWAENIYPGVRCDVPSHVYQLTFAPNTKWSEYYCEGGEIQEYYENVCKEFGLNDHLRLGHRIISARWIQHSLQWEIRAQNVSTGEIVIDHADFFVCAQGRTNEPLRPAVPELDKFKGVVVHTAEWSPGIEYKGKRVAVLGNGASGQQIIPSILPEVDHVDHYVRSKVYVTPTIRDSLMKPSKDNPGAHTYTDEEKARFYNDLDAYLEYRKSLDRGMSGKWYSLSLNTEATAEVKQQLLDEMLSRLGGDTQWLEKIKPDYEPGCKRLAPGPGYIESLLDPKVEYIDTPIVKATATGLQTADGKERPVDIIIAATGFRDGFTPRFPTIGKTGDLAQDWRADGRIGYPETYLGIMAPNTPNYFSVLQAYGNAFGGSVPLHCEVSAAFIARVIRKLQRDGYRACSPSQEATDDFNEVIDKYFEKSVVQSDCSSWFKLTGSGRVVVGWPGTTRHRIEALADPRWEDFEFEGPASDADQVNGGRRNRFWFWSNGETAADRDKDYDVLLSHQTKIGEVNFQTLHDSAY